MRIIFVLVINQLDAHNLFYNKFISCLYMFRAPCAHRQEVKIVLYSLWYHHIMPLHVSSTMCSSSGGQNCIIQPLVSSHHASTDFEHHVVIVRRSKLCYTASGIITSCLYMFKAPCAHRQEVKIVLEAESTPGPQCDRKDYVNEKFQ